MLSKIQKMKSTVNFIVIPSILGSILAGHIVLGTIVGCVYIPSMLFGLEPFWSYSNYGWGGMVNLVAILGLTYGTLPLVQHAVISFLL